MSADWTLVLSLLILRYRGGGGGVGVGRGRFCFQRQWVVLDWPGLTQCYNLDFTVLFVRETTLHLAFLSGLQSFKKLFLFQEKKKM